jgi:hypothetical protein
MIRFSTLRSLEPVLPIVIAASQPMQVVVARLSVEEMIAVAAYAASVGRR